MSQRKYSIESELPISGWLGSSVPGSRIARTTNAPSLANASDEVRVPSSAMLNVAVDEFHVNGDPFGFVVVKPSPNQAFVCMDGDTVLLVVMLVLVFNCPVDRLAEALPLTLPQGPDWA